MKRPKKIFVTGASGLVGGALVQGLAEQPAVETVAMVRSDNANIPLGVTTFESASADPFSEELPLRDVGVIVHAAGRVHVMKDRTVDPLAEFRKVNVEGSLKLARQAALAGVRRFVFISSVKVNGEGTTPGRTYTADDVPAPLDPYGRSKMEAEQGLRAIADESGMEVAIIRPVLVYGPGVKANFLRVMTWVNRGIPLPFGAIQNKRSLVALGNLVDLIITCIEHPAAANQTFLASDGEDISTPDLLQRMGVALGKPARLLPVPPALLMASAAALGNADIARRLCGSLQVDIGKTKRLLGWDPVISLDESLQRTAEHFLQECGS